MTFLDTFIFHRFRPVKVAFALRSLKTIGPESTDISIFLSQLNLVFRLAYKFFIVLVLLPEIETLGLALHKHQSCVMPADFFVFKSTLAIDNAFRLDVDIVGGAVISLLGDL